MELKSHTIEGAFWNIFFVIANKLVTITGQFTLAWFLTPKDMGMANMAQAMVAFATVLSVDGLRNVLLQRRNFEKEAPQTFWISIFFSLITFFSIVVMVLASSFTGKTEVKNLLWILALAVLLGTPATVLGAGLQYNLNYKGFAFSQFSGGVFFTFVAVFLAWIGWGPYSLIVPIVPRQLVTMFVAWKSGGGFPIRKLDWNKARELLKPSISLSVSQFLMGLFIQAPIFVCGMVLSPEQTGFFSWGWMVASQVVFLLASNLEGILLPAFAHISQDHERMTRAALQAAHTITAFLCVVCGTQSLLAKFLIDVLLPAKWQPAIPVVVLFSVCLVSEGLRVSGGTWLNARGKYGWMIFLSSFSVVMNVTLTWLGAHYGGELGAATGCAISVFIGGFWYGWLLKIRTKENNRDFSLKPVLWTIVMWGICFLISWKRNYGIQLLSGFLFFVLDGWIWWYWDKEGMQTVVAKISRKIWPITPNLPKDHV